jgi:GNAT superfamily N-acetyltransferase
MHRKRRTTVVNVEVVRGQDLARIRAFYDAVGYGGGVSEAGISFAATAGGQVIGVVRLCEEDGVTVLRGMQVAPGFRRQGIGRALLAHCMPWLDRGPSYCLPYEHLIGFYGQAGFVPVPPDALPRFLAERLDRYLLSGQRVIAMATCQTSHAHRESHR